MKHSRLESSFWDLVDTDTAAPCWKWTGRLGHRKSPSFRPTAGGEVLASYHAAGLMGKTCQRRLAHPSCGHDWCIHPDHVYGAARPTRAIRAMSELSPEELSDLSRRALRGATQHALALRFHITEADAQKALQRALADEERRLDDEAQQWGHA